jgi:hypothetical protein
MKEIKAKMLTYSINTIHKDKTKAKRLLKKEIVSVLNTKASLVPSIIETQTDKADYFKMICSISSMIKILRIKFMLLL